MQPLSFLSLLRFHPADCQVLYKDERGGEKKKVSSSGKNIIRAVQTCWFVFRPLKNVTHSFCHVNPHPRCADRVPQAVKYLWIADGRACRRIVFENRSR